MSTSTNGVISFGVVCEEDTVFPWDESSFDGDIDVWWRHENGDDHPLPVELCNYCRASVPMYIIALPDVGISCRRGHPQEFIPAELTVTDEQVESLLSFLETYKIESDKRPRWLLSSYWSV